MRTNKKNFIFYNTLRYKSIYIQIVFTLLLWGCSLSVCKSQNVQTNDVKKDTSLSTTTADSLNTDSTAARTMKLSPNAITSIVDYYAEDSITFDIQNNKAYLYNQSTITYEDINLQSHLVELDFKQSELKAEGTTDSSGNLINTPVFKQGDLSFNSEELHYNFDTKKGLIKHVITQQDESFLHGDLVKKDAENNSYISHGKYTTCNLPHPHYEAFFGKAKVMPNDKMVSGPLGIKVAGVPLPVGLPFGYFPMNNQKHKNGLLMPTFGEDPSHGFYFKGIGYYFAIKDVVDFAITGDIYTRGSFGATLASNYAKRYKFDGNISLQYSRMRQGEAHTPEFSATNNFKIYWRHQQSAKAHPTNRFSASVSFMNDGYNRNTVTDNIKEATASSTNSSISFSTSWKSRYSLGINAELTQNLAKKYFNLKLPYINFGISQFYPFRRRKVVGKLRWYENISMQYTLDMANNLAMSYDSTTNILSKSTLNNMRYGIRHTIPVKSTIKILKHITWTNSLNYVEAWQFVGVNRSWRDSVDALSGNHYGVVDYDTNWGFWATHDLTYNTDLSTRLYGMYIMKKGRVVAFRHELAPSVSFNYKPGLNKANYKTYTDQLNHKEIRYSPIEGGMYGVPAYKTSACINFRISNKLEMKLKGRHPGDADRKVTILEDVTLSTGYDFAADSLRWKKLSLSGRTTLLRTITLSFAFDFDPYSIDSSGVRCNTTEWKANHRVFRMSSTSWVLGLGYTFNNNTFKNKTKEKEKVESPSKFGEWSLSFNYNLAYNLYDNYNYYQYYYVDTMQKYDHTLRNIINVNGRVALTHKWSFTFSTGYDFTKKEFSATELGVVRDLHCWEMSFSWIPIGYYRRFEFTIRAKANILRDVKYPYKKNLTD